MAVLGGERNGESGPIERPTFVVLAIAEKLRYAFKGCQIIAVIDKNRKGGSKSHELKCSGVSTTCGCASCRRSTSLV